MFCNQRDIGLIRRKGKKNEIRRGKTKAGAVWSAACVEIL